VLSVCLSVGVAEDDLEAVEPVVVQSAAGEGSAVRLASALCEGQVDELILGKSGV
jgi:hypothetical protein